MSVTFLPLAGLRIISLALNLPGPAALMRSHQLGASCTKIEPPAGDLMRRYSQAAYDEMHQGIEVRTANLKSPEGQALLHEGLAQADLLLTSFRPSALRKLGLAWEDLHARYPHLSQVAIVGAPGDQAEDAGHDLTYQAHCGLVKGRELPATLSADMGGAMQAVEAILLAAMGRAVGQPGRFFEVALAEAAGFMALPRRWGITRDGDILGGAHAGYQVYACRDGRVAVAALEPHFAQRLMKAAGLPEESDPLLPSVKEHLRGFFAAQTRSALDALATADDIPLRTLKD